MLLGYTERVGDQADNGGCFKGTSMTVPLNSHILIVEDDIEFAEWMHDFLLSRGMTSRCVATGEAALLSVSQMMPDLIILDGGLPDIDGFDVCRRIKGQSITPVIMLTARDEEVDEVMGLQAGADDYLTKPVRARALLVRIEKLLERLWTDGVGVASTENDVVSLNGLEARWSSRSAKFFGKDLNLTSQDFELLWLLMSNAGNIVDRNQLVKVLRGFEFDGFDRSIDLRISRLRKKLGDDPAKATLIKTIRGKGYLFST